MNDQQRAAMQGALLALEDAYRRDEHSAARWVYSEAMDALREALAQPQKPDECANGCPERTTCDYCATQPQGEWVDLTDDEIALVTGCQKSKPNWIVVKDITEAVIAAFKEKNK